MWPGGGASLQPGGRGADAYDEPARSVGGAAVQGHAGRSDADVEERGILRPLQGLLAKLAAAGALEHHCILSVTGVMELEHFAVLSWSRRLLEAV